MHRFQRQLQALGSTVLLTEVTDQPQADAEQTFDLLTNYIRNFEQQFSRFLPDSELTLFNRQAGNRVPVTPSFKALLYLSKTMGELTGGIYNPFILPALQQAGYIGSWPAPETTPAPDYRERGVVSVSSLDIGDDWARIPPETALDFGGIGKGYLLDRLSELLQQKAATDYWLSLGGDIVCAGRDLDGQPWQVAIESARTPGDAIDTITNKNGDLLGIATSGITKRKGVTNGVAWHHLIDPRTAQPADTNLLTATVTAARAVDADIFAKCIIIAGANEAEVYQGAGYIQDFSLQDTDGSYITSMKEYL